MLNARVTLLALLLSACGGASAEKVKAPGDMTTSDAAHFSTNDAGRDFSSTGIDNDFAQAAVDLAGGADFAHVEDMAKHSDMACPFIPTCVNGPEDCCNGAQNCINGYCMNLSGQPCNTTSNATVPMIACYEGPANVPSGVCDPGTPYGTCQ